MASKVTHIAYMLCNVYTFVALFAPDRANITSRKVFIHRPLWRQHLRTLFAYTFTLCVYSSDVMLSNVSSFSSGSSTTPTPRPAEGALDRLLVNGWARAPRGLLGGRLGLHAAGGRLGLQPPRAVWLDKASRSCLAFVHPMIATMPIEADH